jgi:hypothetical protein
MFRLQMAGGGVTGLAYLPRPSLPPTQEDWQTGAEERTSWLRDAARRPFRLFRKYGSDGLSYPPRQRLAHSEVSQAVSFLLHFFLQNYVTSSEARNLLFSRSRSDCSSYSGAHFSLRLRRR